MADITETSKGKSASDSVALDHVEYASKPHRTSPAEQQARLKDALDADPGLQAWTLRALQFYLIVLCACFCSGDNGFDGTVMGGVNAMNQYQTYFGMSGAGASTSIVFGIYTVGSFVAALPASYIPDRLGRRASMFFGNCLTITGALVTATARNRSTFIGGRFLTGLGTATASASAKSYLAEITPPTSRGLFMGFLNSFYYVGQIAATGMMVSTGSWSGNLSWRLPLLIQVVPAALNVIFVFFCPESPRWLYTVGKKNQARAVLARLHSSTGDVNSPLVDVEMSEIEETIKLGGADKRWWDYRTLFRTRGDRYRISVASMIGAFGQLSGNNLITYFLPVLLGAAGITSQRRKLTLNFVNSITSFVGALTGSAILDRIGRRKLIIPATCGCVICLAIVTGLLSGSTYNATRSNAGISFVYLFMVIFSFGWTPMQGVYAAEVLAYESRAKGLAFYTIVSQAVSLINTFALPIALQRITWKVYVIFLAWDCFEVVMLWLFLVETKGLTLEQIEDVFAQPNPRDYSVRLRLQATRSHPGRV
ncbi:general substrate transporter [Vararia minispora EC-137]|uniref:General substrate transporter n=1 Tax=Vararia minispora EC-137 TaxID=1314806 RepID=A0ACB8QI31_9AGAM|nr:general substrate transporter [Vararia minispora EC-137]